MPRLAYDDTGEDIDRYFRYTATARSAATGLAQITGRAIQVWAAGAKRYVIEPDGSVRNARCTQPCFCAACREDRRAAR